MNGLTAWSVRHGVSAAALQELRRILMRPVTSALHAPDVALSEASVTLSEAAVQNNVRLANAQRGTILWRNNVGTLPDARGIPVRFGLANDSKKLNDVCKSSDLIGIEAITIMPEHIGAVIGRFVALECKKSDWKYANTPCEQAQANFINIINAHGGRASFTTGHTL
jgi:hypothetical protein